jgi:hypothetical protein
LLPTKRNRRGEGGGRQKVWTEQKIRELADELLHWITEDLLPGEDGKIRVTRFFMKEFAVVRGIPSDYFPKFARQSEYFREAYARCKDVQEMKLVKYGLAGQSVGMVMYMLNKHHGYAEPSSPQDDPSREPEQKQAYRIGGKLLEF